MKTVQNEKGFTLIEALIVMVILSVGILTLVTMQTTSLKGNSKANGISTASNWAQDNLESQLNEDYDEVADGTATSIDGLYSIRRSVTDPILTSVPYSTLKQIEVTVTRTDFGDQRDITFNYYRQKNF